METINIISYCLIIIVSLSAVLRQAIKKEKENTQYNLVHTFYTFLNNNDTLFNQRVSINLLNMDKELGQEYEEYLVEKTSEAKKTYKRMVTALRGFRIDKHKSYERNKTQTTKKEHTIY